MNGQITVSRQLMEDCLEQCREHRSLQPDWWKDEKRGKYQQRWNELQKVMDELEKLLATEDQRQPSGNVSVPETQESPSDHHGFPPTNEEEIKAFKIWLLDPKRKKESDELAYLKESSDGFPKGWILERFRRHKESNSVSSNG